MFFQINKMNRITKQITRFTMRFTFPLSSYIPINGKPQ
ncbi:hypothetical protein PMAG_a4187 [Pseudoalteromonas mariniglutinosa NCIMB 1770]|nr:hypothetical protein [Pseudoalteromonas mariniglutinosa NCIMB 1770]